MGPFHLQTHVPQFWVISRIFCFDNVFSPLVFFPCYSDVIIYRLFLNFYVFSFYFSLVSPVEYFIFIIFLFPGAFFFVVAVGDCSVYTEFAFTA